MEGNSAALSCGQWMLMAKTFAPKYQPHNQILQTQNTESTLLLLQGACKESKLNVKSLNNKVCSAGSSFLLITCAGEM